MFIFQNIILFIQLIFIILFFYFIFLSYHWDIKYIQSGGDGMTGLDVAWDGCSYGYGNNGNGD